MRRKEAEAIRDEHDHYRTVTGRAVCNRGCVPWPCPTRRLAEAYLAAMEALQHMRWCRSCAEGDWSDCGEGGASAATLVAAFEEGRPE
jgi:hypothetical protein